ncbi:MAG: PDZ domain-containing protein [Myxococcales bacterium]|nr:PDZ domain-containing protein [Myxococcales bacterium]
MLEAIQKAHQLDVHRTDEQQHTMLRFEGVLDESFGGAELAGTVRSEVLVLDLAGVRRVTSFGIREWLRFIEQVGERCRQILLVDCSPRVVHQLNMVVRFAGRGQVLSVLAPYVCERCEATYDRRMDIVEHDQEIRTFAPAVQPCSICEGQAVFDDDPARFFAYLASQPRPIVRPETGAFLSRQLEGFNLGTGGATVSVVKVVEGEQTVIRLLGELNNTLPVEQLVEGVEGEVALDLAGITRLTPSGAHLWGTFAAELLGAAARVRIFSCSPALLSPLRTLVVGDATPLEVHTATLPYRCATCSTSLSREISIVDDAEPLAGGVAPARQCVDCGNALQCVADPRTLVELSELSVPMDAPDVRELVEKVRKSSEAAERSVASSQAAAGPRKRWPWIVVVSTLTGVVAALAVLALMPEPTAPLPPKPKYYEASHLAAPPWRDKKIFKEASAVFAVARSTLSGDKATAFAEASHASLERMLYHLHNVLARDSAWGALIAPHVTTVRKQALGALAKPHPEDIARLEAARRRVRSARQRIAKSWAETSHHLVPPVVEANYWESYRKNNQVAYRVWARSRITSLNFDKAREHYSKRWELLGSKVVTFFPLLCWTNRTLDRGAVVASVTGKLEKAGLKVGDIVTSVNEARVSDGESLLKLVERTAAKLSKAGGELVLDVARIDDGSTRQVKLTIKKSAYRGGGGGGGSSGGPRTMPPANIFHADPSK